MLQALVVVSTSSILFTVYIVLFHNYAGENNAVANCMSHFSMFVPTKSDVKLANGNMGHAQVIRIILCNFTNCPIIYPVVPVFYCPGNPSNTISSGDLKFYLGYQNITYEHLEHCDFVYHQGSSWRSPYHTRKCRLSSKTLCQSQTLKKKIYCGSNCLWSLKWNISQLIYHYFDQYLITRLRLTAKKLLMKGLTTNIGCRDIIMAVLLDGIDVSDQDWI